MSSGAELAPPAEGRRLRCGDALACGPRLHCFDDTLEPCLASVITARRETLALLVPFAAEESTRCTGFGTVGRYEWRRRVLGASARNLNCRRSPVALRVTLCKPRYLQSLLVLGFAALSNSWDADGRWIRRRLPRYCAAIFLGAATLRRNNTDRIRSRELR